MAASLSEKQASEADQRVGVEKERKIGGDGMGSRREEINDIPYGEQKHENSEAGKNQFSFCV